MPGMSAPERERQVAIEAAYRAGQVDQRLDGHDAHFARLNGSLDDTAAAMRELVSRFDVLVTTLKVRDETMAQTIGVANQARAAGFSKLQLRLASIGLALAAAGPYIAHWLGIG